MTTRADCCEIPSIVIFFTNTGLTALEPIRMPVVLQYSMFVPDFNITYKKNTRYSGQINDATSNHMWKLIYDTLFNAL